MQNSWEKPAMNIMIVITIMIRMYLFAVQKPLTYHTSVLPPENATSAAW